MGQKVSPIGFRVGVNKDWNATWYADKKSFADNLIEDQKIRKFLKKNYSTCAISRIAIERTENKLVIDLHTGKPGMIIGQKGAGIENIKKEIAKMIKPVKLLVINVKEIKKPDLDATLVAEGIAAQLEKRIQWRRALKMGIQKVMKAGAKGCKVQLNGVIDGANTQHRSEHYMEGSLPLHTIRADIDFGSAAAYTNYGKLGVKCWIYKGEILGKKSSDKGGQDNVNA